MSDTPIADGWWSVYIEADNRTEAASQIISACGKIERELGEANSEVKRLREMLEEAAHGLTCCDTDAQWELSLKIRGAIARVDTPPTPRP